MICESYFTQALSFIVEATTLSARQLRYYVPDSRCAESVQTDDRSSQYYMMATCTVLVYDYLLTLADEVR